MTTEEKKDQPVPEIKEEELREVLTPEVEVD